MTDGFLLDTNVPSELIRKVPDPRVRLWINLQAQDLLFLSAVTVGELRKGISLLAQGKRRSALEAWLQKELLSRFPGRILPITQAVAERWGVVTAQRQRAGAPLAIMDGLIAATALEHNLTLVTRNVRDMKDLGVELLNPWELAL